MGLSDLGAVLVEGDVADPVEAVLDTPVAAVEGEQALWRGLLGGEVGDAAHPLKALLTGLGEGDVTLDQAGLAKVGEVEIVVEGGGGADRALLNAPVSLIDGDVLRGGWRPSRRP
jgi:hypothetical protein